MVTFRGQRVLCCTLPGCLSQMKFTSTLGPVLLNIFIGDLEEAMKYLLLRFANDSYELGGLLNILKARTAIHRDLESLEEWANRNQQNSTRTNPKPCTAEGTTPAVLQTGN